MPKYTMIAAAFLLLGIAAAGCGSDDDKVTQPTVEEQYDLLQFPLDQVWTHVLEQLAFHPDSLDYFDPGGGGYRSGVLGRPAGPDRLFGTNTYIYQDGWHIIDITGTFDYGPMHLVDSIRFTDSRGEPQEDPSRATTVAMRIIEHLFLTYTEEPWEGTAEAHIDLSHTNLQSSVFEVDGIGVIEMDLILADEQEPYECDVTCTIDLDHIAVANPALGGSGCPVGGSLVLWLAGSVSGYTDDGKHVSVTIRNLTAVVVINDDGTADVTVSIGGSQFHETVPTCDAGA